MTPDSLLRVCTYNIHKGFAANNRHLLIENMRAAIRDVDADVVFLQEVLGARDDLNDFDTLFETQSQFEYLADQVWPHFAYGKNAVYEAGHHGNALMSRYPIDEWRNFDVTCFPKSHRGILYAKIKGGIHLFCVHLGFLPLEQKKQLVQLADIIQQQVADEEPIVVAGDFNDWAIRANGYLFERLGLVDSVAAVAGRSAKTFPSKFPLLPLDRIYCRGVTVQNAKVLHSEPWDSLSDHCALFAELAIGKD